MRHSAAIHLIKGTTTSYDELMQPVKTNVERLVFANEMSVSIAEHYAAGNSNMKPEKQFEIYSFEYEGESTLRHDNRVYKIIRVSGQGDKLRIICERVIGHVTT